MSRVKTLQDQMNRLFLTSDPILTSMRKLRKRKRMELGEKITSLLKNFDDSDDLEVLENVDLQIHEHETSEDEDENLNLYFPSESDDESEDDLDLENDDTDLPPEFYEDFCPSV